MSLATELLAQAQHLADLDAARPVQANLRRSISTAYYALFHLLLAETSERIAPKTPLLLAPRIARSLAHGEMKDACLQIVKPNPGFVLLELVPYGFSPELRRIARFFVELQSGRHLADYDLAATFTQNDAVEFIRFARKAFEDWAAIRTSDEANVFLCSLLFAKRWSK